MQTRLINAIMVIGLLVAPLTFVGQAQAGDKKPNWVRSPENFAKVLALCRKKFSAYDVTAEYTSTQGHTGYFCVYRR